MEKIRYDEEWLRLLAEQLVIDVTDWMAGVPLTPGAPPGPADRRPMDAVYVRMEGELSIWMRMELEPCLVHRLAAHIIGREPESQEEAREYAAEYFNVLCGRFLSELCRGKRPKMQFSVPCYEAYPQTTPAAQSELDTVYLRSEQQEQIQFSWVVYVKNDPAQ